MLISCPSCPKTYTLAETVIPPEGRELKCSSCDTVWLERPKGAEIDGADIDNVSTEPRHQASLTAPPKVDSDMAVKALAALLAENETEAAFEEVLALGDQATCAAYGDETINTINAGDELLVETSLGEEAGVEDEAWQMPDFSSAIPPERGLTVHIAREIPDAEFSAKEDFAKADNVLDAAAHQVAQLALFEQMRTIWQNWNVSWQEWQARRVQEDVTSPGDQATAALRYRIRQKQRNQFTPLRALGWLGWSASIVGLVVMITTQRAMLEQYFPPSAKLYARVDPFLNAPLSVENLAVRYVQSSHGPVLEVRGVVINEGANAVVPDVVLTPIGSEDIIAAPVSISAVPLPYGGARPFVVRAAWPDDVTRATLSVRAGSATPAPGQFVLQRSGSGWGQRLPENIAPRADVN